MPTFLADSHFSYILNSVDIFSLLSIPFFGISTIYWLPLFFIIFLWWIFFREKVGIPTPNLLMKQYSRTPFSLSIIWIIRVSILSLLFLLFIRAWGTSSEMEDRRDPEQATIIALDISKSMETDDLSPSRIEYAKNIILEHTDTLGHLGVVIFAGKTFILSPITTDTRGINYLIETLSTDTINQNENETSGTNIGDSIIQASTIFPQ